MNKCEAWHEAHPAHGAAFGVCYGTKECEPCDCGGDEAKCDFYHQKRKKAAVPQFEQWISVKERLPENEESVLIAGCREGISGKLWPVVMTAFHIDGKMLAQDSCYAWSDSNIEMEYDEDADDFIIPEGWFEDVQCADEFSMVYDIRVTHWMPLPEPPKEA